MTCGQKIDETARFCIYCGAPITPEEPKVGTQPHSGGINPTESTPPPFDAAASADLVPPPPMSTQQPYPPYQHSQQQVVQPNLETPAQEASVKKKKWPLFLLIGTLVLLLAGAGVVAWYLISNNNSNDALSSSVQDGKDKDKSKDDGKDDDKNKDKDDGKDDGKNKDKDDGKDDDKDKSKDDGKDDDKNTAKDGKNEHIKGGQVFLDNDTCKITIGSGTVDTYDSTSFFSIEAVVENKTNKKIEVFFDLETTLDGADSEGDAFAMFVTGDFESVFLANSITPCDLWISTYSNVKNVENFRGTITIYDEKTFDVIGVYPYNIKSIPVKKGLSL